MDQRGQKQRVARAVGKVAAISKIRPKGKVDKEREEKWGSGKGDCILFLQRGNEFISMSGPT